jgi:hypothetical protein
MRVHTASRIKLLSLLSGLLVLIAAGLARGDAESELSEAKLKSMIENMGYEFVEAKYSSGRAYYQLTVPYQEVDYKVDVSRAADGQLVWVVLDLKSAPTAVDLPTDVLAGMLDDNHTDSEEIFFSYSKPEKQFRLKGSLPGATLRLADLQRAVDEAVRKCNRTYKLWNPDEWPTATDTKFDDARLKTMLENLGLEVNAKSGSNGVPYYEILESRPTVNCAITFQLSGNKEFLWVTANLGSVPENRAIPREILVKMLDASYDSAYMRFTVNSQTRFMRLEQSFPVKSVTPLLLRQAFKEGCDMVEKYEEVWNVNKWPSVDASATGTP